MFIWHLSSDAQDDFGECEYHDADEDDGGTRWLVEQITDVETGDAVYPSQDDACPYHLPVIIGEEVGATVDGLLTNVVESDGKQLLKVVAWYDNEVGYTAQMIRTMKLFM